MSVTNPQHHGGQSTDSAVRLDDSVLYPENSFSSSSSVRGLKVSLLLPEGLSFQDRLIVFFSVSKAQIWRGQCWIHVTFFLHLSRQHAGLFDMFCLIDVLLSFLISL